MKHGIINLDWLARMYHDRHVGTQYVLCSGRLAPYWFLRW